MLQRGTPGVNLLGRDFNQLDAAVPRPTLIRLVARHRRIGSRAESNQPASGNSVFGDEGADDRLRARLGELHSKDKNDLKAGFYDTGQFVQLTGGFSFICGSEGVLAGTRRKRYTTGVRTATKESP